VKINHKVSQEKRSFSENFYVAFVQKAAVPSNRAAEVKNFRRSV
jgi:hypothetical protein